MCMWNQKFYFASISEVIVVQQVNFFVNVHGEEAISKNLFDSPCYIHLTSLIKQAFDKDYDQLRGNCKI